MNPRLVAQHTISSRADSAALALLRACSPVRLTAAEVLVGDVLVKVVKQRPPRPTVSARRAAEGLRPTENRPTSSFGTRTLVKEFTRMSLRDSLSFTFV